eukprot:TRINITY_DN42684_c0_g1_i1.p1 TRINITY_DN42684_c0_g1~~TRINITY_DN42684_c0_g1_i1.p1  ORF type:complete len:172 (+),score=49.74 TRINITY_DN42684_c0_g1_i1:3-518(+)
MLSRLAPTFTSAMRLRAPASIRMAEAAAATGEERLTLKFSDPMSAIVDGEVDSVTIPGSSGVFGVHPRHVPTIAELKPGVVTVEDASAEEKTRHYFVSSGFAIVEPDSVVRINAIAAVPLDQIDADAAKKGLDKYTAAASSAADETAKAEAEIGVEVHEAMVNALQEHNIQ